MTFPVIDEMTEERRAELKAEFGQLMQEVEAETSTEEQPAPRRKRGRPPGSRNRPKPGDYAPASEQARFEVPTLNNPPISTRDQREVAKRLAGILEGATGIASLAKPYFQMTEEEAEAIAVPLTTYLIRTEATSGVARQVLDEYDIVAFGLALAAYVVRVWMDFSNEQSTRRESRRRAVEQPSVEIVQESSTQTQSGQERPVDNFDISAPSVGWTPAQI